MGKEGREETGLRGQEWQKRRGRERKTDRKKERWKAIVLFCKPPKFDDSRCEAFYLTHFHHIKKIIITWKGDKLEQSIMIHMCESIIII